MSLGYLRRSSKTRPVSTRSGEKATWKSMPSVRPLPALEQGLPPRPGGPDRERRLVQHKRVRGEVLGDRIRGAVHPAEVGLILVIDEQWHDDDDGVSSRGWHRRTTSSRARRRLGPAGRGSRQGEPRLEMAHARR